MARVPESSTPPDTSEIISHAPCVFAGFGSAKLVQISLPDDTGAR